VPSVFERRSPETEWLIPQRPGSAAASSALPTTKYVSLATSVARPRYAKKSSWNRGVITIIGTATHGVSQAKRAR
jgi:hypothetical protein